MLMSRRHDRLAPVRVPFAPLALTIIAGVALGSVGCKEDFSDEKFGVLDLAGFYDGGSTRNPGGGIPSNIAAAPGYVSGSVAEFYDFGTVPAIINTAGVPVGVRVQPMYFFFDSHDQPLFSHPVREQRDGTDWMKGGKAVLDPNPKDFCDDPGADPVACKKRNEDERQKSYPLRQRDYVKDRNRGVSDFQRPLVDLVPGNDNPPRGQYTGLWEIIEVTVPDGYDPDSIKHVATLDKAIESGKYSKRATGKVINCPILDERTYVARGVTARKVFHPRIELWYRRQLAFCFLANGWETLGNDGGQLYFAHSDLDRFDTFDVSRVEVGSGIELTVNVGKAYNPVGFRVDPDTGDPKVAVPYPDNTIVEERPRRSKLDPGGYTPMRWMFSVPAPREQFVRGTWKSVKDIDASSALGDPVVVHNLSVRGVAVPCSYPQWTELNPAQCGKKINTSGPLKLQYTGDPACNAEGDPSNPKDAPLECNPDTCFCDAPFVGYGQACGSGIAQCFPPPMTPDEFGDFGKYGYQCFPPWGGFCQRACNPAEANTLAAQNMGKERKDQLDSRCGGLPGLVCFQLNVLGTCVKFCDQNVTDPNQCSAVVKVGNGTEETQEGQVCLDYGISICSWPDTYSPKPFSAPM